MLFFSFIQHFCKEGIESQEKKHIWVQKIQVTIARFC